MTRSCGWAVSPKRKCGSIPAWANWLGRAGRREAGRRGLRPPQATLWIPAERLHEFRALWPEARLRAGRSRRPPIGPERLVAEEALVEILRGRLEGSGPVTPTALAGAARARAGGDAPRWPRWKPKARSCAAASSRAPTTSNGATAGCSRASTATRSAACARRSSRSRRAISCASCSTGSTSATETRAGRAGRAPLASRRRWKDSRRRRGRGRRKSCRRASRATKPRGSTPNASPGRSAWARLTPPAGAGDGRAVRPSARRRSRSSTGGGRGSGCRLRHSPAAPSLGPRAQAVLDCLAAPRRLVFRRIDEATRLLRPQVEEALGELVTLGLVTSDSFAGLRALLAPSGQRKPHSDVKRRGRVLPFEIESGGRWALIRRVAAGGRRGGAGRSASNMSRGPCLRRYGVVFWRLLAREAGVAAAVARPACGSIAASRRAARFAAAASSPASPASNIALPEAVGLVAGNPPPPAGDRWVSLSAADPLNLVGVLTPGAEARGADRQPPRLSRRRAGRLAFGARSFSTDLDGAERWDAEKRLVRSAASGLLASLA